MNLEPIAGSSTITGVGYDPASKVLAVRFKSRAVYHYEGVDPGVHQRFRAAKSAGKFFAGEVRDKFKHVRQSER